MGKITIESNNVDLLNTMLTGIMGHFNKEQNNFKLNTEGFEVDSDDEV